MSAMKMTIMPTPTRRSAMSFGVPACAARRARPRRGFTLIELLIVISVIVVLLGLLLPVVQSLREAARTTYCSSHQAQIGTAMHKFIEVNTRPPTAKEILSAKNMAPFLEDELEAGKMLVCPTGALSGDANLQGAYGANRCLDRLSNEPTKVVLTDSIDQVLEWEKSDLPTWIEKGPNQRHSGMVNVLYFDGSVQRQVPDDINPYLAGVGSGIRERLWRPRLGCALGASDSPDCGPIVDQGLIVWLKFDDEFALGTDSSGKGNHFQEDSASGKFRTDVSRNCNGGVLFSTDDKAAPALRSLTTGLLAGKSGMTACWWFKNDSSSGSNHQLTSFWMGSSDMYRGQWLLQGNGPPTVFHNQVCNGLCVDVHANQPPPGTGIWTHYACARDTQGRLWGWINGSSSNSSTPACGTAPLGSPCVVTADVGKGWNNTASSVWCGLDKAVNTPYPGAGKTGTFDDFRLYDRVLSDFEVRQIYDKTKTQ